MLTKDEFEKIKTWVNKHKFSFVENELIASPFYKVIYAKDILNYLDKAFTDKEATDSLKGVGK